MKLYPKLQEYITSLKPLVDDIPNERKELLLEVASYLKTVAKPSLNFICTHNSRRSHLGQIWSQVMADYCNIEVETFSGGTEATAFNPNAIAALKRAGFQIGDASGDNPKYQVKVADEAKPMVCFSKRYDDEPNPMSGFVAIMTCSEADNGCPVVLGASKRIKLLYEDPKVADGTLEEASKYDERCKQIATEMFFIFSQMNC